MENQRMLSTQEAVVGGTEGGPGPTGVPPTTAAAEGAGRSGPRAGSGNGQQRPDPAVPEKPVRRRFDAEYKYVRRDVRFMSPAAQNVTNARANNATGHVDGPVKRCAISPTDQQTGATIATNTRVTWSDPAPRRSVAHNT